MKATELRIGNYVNVSKGYQYPFRIDSFEFLICNFEKPGITPICLNKEWLEKFDWFSIDEDRYMFRDIEYYCISEEGSLYFMNQYTATEIKYVHQLQNLYFALTGYELQLNGQYKVN